MLQLTLDGDVLFATGGSLKASNAELFFMKTKKMIANAVRENPDIALVLEVSARAKETEQREPVQDLTPATDVAANPTNTQGSVSSGCVLSDERDLVA
jgi:hypothetical protein